MNSINILVDLSASLQMHYTCHSIIEFHYNTIVGTQEFELWRKQFLSQSAHCNWANRSIGCFN